VCALGEDPHATKCPARSYRAWQRDQPSNILKSARDADAQRLRKHVTDRGPLGIDRCLEVCYKYVHQGASPVFSSPTRFAAGARNPYPHAVMGREKAKRQRCRPRFARIMHPCDSAGPTGQSAQYTRLGGAEEPSPKGLAVLKGRHDRGCASAHCASGLPAADT